MKAPKTNEKSWHPTPPDILAHIKTAERAVKRLQALAEKEGIERKFTLDGRLVGDIGELVVARYFEIVRNDKPSGHAHDLFATIKGLKRGVQVKLRREDKSGRLSFKYLPEVLIFLKFDSDWSRFQIVYHGSGDIIGNGAIETDEKRRFKAKGVVTEVSMTPLEFAAQVEEHPHSSLQMTPIKKR
jgi:hypothetical protein